LILDELHCDRVRSPATPSHGVLTPEQAHRITAGELAAARAGHDSATGRQKVRRALSVADLVVRHLASRLMPAVVR
jgi:hypothetical protein